MIFNSLQYALFLPIVLGLYWLLNRREQNILLLAASYYFYAVWDVRFLALMWISTGTDYLVGRLLEANGDERKRKRIFLASLVVNLGILGFFKYFNFFVDSAVDLLQAVGLEGHRPTLQILLPIGISFYTFHGISYTFDVYRRDLPACSNLIDFACFVAYFPQLVAGPIGRAQVQLPQFANPRRRPSSIDVRSALFLIALGLFKKVAIADALAPYVNQTFGRAGQAGAAQLLVGMYAFVLQVYGDFSGYSDIARGSSRLFGIELLRNFEQPFLSRNLTEFWRRWHISLANWLRDYLFTPLGGLRPKLAARATMITMLIAGLWHGAKWTFVVWGGLQGLVMVIERWWILGARKRERRRATIEPIGGSPKTLPVDPRHEPPVVERAVAVAQRREAPLPPPFRWRRDVLPAVYTFHIFALTAIFFRAESFSQAGDYFTGLFGLRSGPLNTNFAVLLVLAFAVVAAIDIIQRNGRDETPVIHWPAPVAGIVYGIFILTIGAFSGGTTTPFIYFQF